MIKKLFLPLFVLIILGLTYSCADVSLSGGENEVGFPEEYHAETMSTSYDYPFYRYLKLTSPPMTGSDIKLLQILLNDWSTARGYSQLYVDGEYGSVTKSKVTTFQSYYGLYADGEAGPVTLNKVIDVFTLGSSYISPYYRDLYLKSPEMWGDDIKNLQRAYNVWASRNGKTALYVDGNYGSVTKSAIKLFQGAEPRLYVDGYSGKQTQRLLYVRSWGSSTPSIPDSSWTRPLAGYYVSQEYKGASVHNGIDLAKAYGSGIYAARSGKIKAILLGYLSDGSRNTYTLSGWVLDPVYGMSGDKVVIEHADGKLSIYDHCGAASGMYVGKIVYKDQLIGYINRSGNRTGPHLHFAIFTSSSYYSPTNPRNYIGF